ETALRVSGGIIKIDFVEEDRVEILSESNSCPKCGTSYPELSPQHFSFNSPIGMCKTCNGLGTKMEFDPNLVVPDPSISIFHGAVVPWGKLSGKKSWRRKRIESVADTIGFSIKTPWEKYPKKIKQLLLYGSKRKKFEMSIDKKNFQISLRRKFEGVIPTLQRRMKETSSEYMKRYYMQFLSSKPCPDCNGHRLATEFQSVYIRNKSITDITNFTIGEAMEFFQNIDLINNEKIIAEEVLKEVNERLSFLLNVGLHYLTLDRKAPTLSGGESQRIRLASQIGSGLVGVMYILDEPSIGLHQRDNDRLIEMLIHLRDLGNTVLVVEHDEEMMRRADHILDFGPFAGVLGGEIVAQGNYDKIVKSKKSLTGKYLSGKKKIEIPTKRRKPDKRFLEIIGAKQNNLKNIDVKIPVGVFNCITGVSGSGKSSLINQTLYPAVANTLNRASHKESGFSEIKGIRQFDKIISIDQQPIGRTPRSNPATYVKLFDTIRNLFSQLPAAKIKGFKPGRFSFNVKGGRCEACSGAGVKKIEMHFLADVYVTCEVCRGKRYNRETLSIKYKGKTISEVLDLDVQEAFELFKNVPKIKKKLQTLIDVGLNYIKLGQASTTLSGGEAQRIKLARELSKTSTGNTLYLLDEPTTGLHFDDINKLLSVLHRLTAMGNTIIVIEHNLDVIKSCDYVIDLGPEGGNNGGKIIAKGTPEQICKVKKSYTGQYLKNLFLDADKHRIE
ncbi:MAG: excinuclease ABC subunit UvrA, partial [Candidatus Cloacimonadota bacterium]|nr:excinuclease ABC subunit UvrA [Candidatus Cloacimonadota bacterium]